MSRSAIGKMAEPSVFSLDPTLEPSEDIAKRFAQAKKCKRGLVLVETRARTFQKLVDEWKTKIDGIDRLEDPNQLQAWMDQLQPSANKRPSPRSTTIQTPKPYLEFASGSGLKILVGKNAKGNDKLTFSYARGSDWWFHVRNYSGSHVVLKVEKGKDPDDASVQEAIQFAIAYSKAQDKGEARGLRNSMQICPPARHWQGNPWKNYKFLSIKTSTRAMTRKRS